jgi:hypothetical protein
LSTVIDQVIVVTQAEGGLLMLGNLPQELRL